MADSLLPSTEQSMVLVPDTSGEGIGEIAVPAGCPGGEAAPLGLRVVKSASA